MPKNILVADDDKNMRNLYSRIFGGTPYAITLAGSIAEASGLIEANNYDLLIADLMFPDGQGTDLVRIFRKKCPEQKSILISGSLPGGSTFACDGLYRIIEKPFDVDVFIEAVASALA